MSGKPLAKTVTDIIFETLKDPRYTLDKMVFKSHELQSMFVKKGLEYGIMHLGETYQREVRRLFLGKVVAYKGISYHIQAFSRHTTNGMNEYKFIIKKFKV